jgi:hypothetical protein
LRSVQRIWQAHGLDPHRIRRFKLSRGATELPAGLQQQATAAA